MHGRLPGPADPVAGARVECSSSGISPGLRNRPGSSGLPAQDKQPADSFSYTSSFLLRNLALFRLLDPNQAPRALLERVGQLIQVVRCRTQVFHSVVNSASSLRSGSRVSVTVPFTF